MDQLRNAQWSRRSGIKAFMDYLDSPSPAKLSDATTDFELAGKYLQDALERMTNFQQALEPK